MLNCNTELCDLDEHINGGNEATATLNAERWLYIPSTLEGFVQTSARPAYIRTAQGEMEHKVLVFHGYQKIQVQERVCCKCGGKMHVHKKGLRKLTDVPRGDFYSMIEVEVVSLRCVECRHVQWQVLPYQMEGARITKNAEEYIRTLLARQEFSNTAIAELTGVCRNTIKLIDFRRLTVLYTTVDENGKPVLNKPTHLVRILAIDEFLLHSGNQFATHIIDHHTGEILWIAHGKKKQVVYDFIEHVGLEWMQHVEALACDMNSDFEEAFLEKCPHMKIVYDHFHIVKNFNEKVIDEVRKDEVDKLKEEGKDAEAKAFKGTKYLLMETAKSRADHDERAKAGETKGTDSQLFNLSSHKMNANHQERYEAIISKNKLLFSADLVKEELAYLYGSFKTANGEIEYNCKDPEEMRKRIENIITICEGTGNPHFRRFAKLLRNHIDGIVAFAELHITSGKMEGINNRIKTLRRISYGISDDEYFFLKIIDMSRSKLATKARAAARREAIKRDGFTKATRKTLVIQAIIPTPNAI